MLINFVKLKAVSNFKQNCYFDSIYTLNFYHGFNCAERILIVFLYTQQISKN